MEETIETLVTPETLRAAGFEKVDQVIIDEGPDSTGDPSYSIYILMNDDVTSDELSYKNIRPMMSWVFRRAWEFSKEKVWPYVRVKRVKEFHPIFAR